MNSSLEQKRHTLAHLLAAEVLKRYPEAKLTLGPAIENGFYYDIDFSQGESLREDDLKSLQESMVKQLPTWTEFTHQEVSEPTARELFSDNKYKLELIDEIVKKNEPITLYTCNGFTDLCRGGHCQNPAHDIASDSFLLDKIAGAYWRGDEKNSMLTRIYGLAFDTKAELDKYLEHREEAKKRDHRKIAKEQDLLVFSDLVGSGMPMWTPRGNILRNAVVEYSRELNDRLGFGEVYTPNINKADLFKLSGHYDQYKEDMLSVSSQYVDEEMFLKPMNCPQHTQIFASRPRSYKDLPIRYSDFANLYRDERPGELSGLTRLRAFAQDDGHVFCRYQQIESEISNILEVIEEALKTYNIAYWMRLSLRDDVNKEKYLGEDSVWEESEGILKKLLQEKKIDHKEVTGEAAFYGPKVDIMAVDALDREWQISTVQLDFSQPERFDLNCINEKGEKERVVMIHRALIGSPDRFLGILIEHYAGAFPLWLSPEQVRVLPVAVAHTEFAQGVVDQLKTAGIRAEIDDTNESLGKKIRSAKQDKLPYFAVVGDKEASSNTIALEKHNGDKVEGSVEELIEKLVTEIKNRTID
ncbi:threonine--tRNA ligase [bacterium]|nr:threonine--tRNA ligase [bacterium]